MLLIYRNLRTLKMMNESLQSNGSPTVAPSDGPKGLAVSDNPAHEIRPPFRPRERGSRSLIAIVRYVRLKAPVPRRSVRIAASQIKALPNPLPLIGEETTAKQPASPHLPRAPAVM
jgi:hypothetical protein